MAGETVTRVREVVSGEDRYGNPTSTTVDELDIDGAFVDPGTSDEPVVIGGQPVTTSPTLYFPQSRPDIVSGDRVRVRGELFDVKGTPADWRSPFGSSVGGLVVQLSRTSGGSA